jgi:hypothetical protein
LKKEMELLRTTVQRERKEKAELAAKKEETLLEKESSLR